MRERLAAAAGFGLVRETLTASEERF